MYVLFTAAEAPKERPRLALKPRSVPAGEETSDTSARQQPAPVPADSGSKVQESNAAQQPTSASIFGGAKPVDTAARERAIEERLKEKQREREAQASQRDSTRGRETDRQE